MRPMNVIAHEEFSALVLAPVPGDDPQGLPDRIGDELKRTQCTTVVLDLSAVDGAGPWLKAAGPQIPDANLRVVLNEKEFAMARVLDLTAHFEWFPSLDAALRQGV